MTFGLDGLDTDSTIIWILLGVVLLCIAFFLILVYNYPSNNYAGAAHKDCYMNVTSVYTPFSVNGTNYTAVTNITHAGFCMSA